MTLNLNRDRYQDFPNSLLELIASTPNLCRNLHLPAQSGSSKVLEGMRRGYCRDAYIELVDKARTVIPGIYCCILS